MSAAAAGVVQETTTPYVGLRPFQPEDSGLFFGRRPQVIALLDLLGQHRFLPVVGSSGCGKSSLIRAGVIPALRAGFLVQDRDEWVVATMTPGGAPLRRLIIELVRACGDSGSPLDETALLSGIDEIGDDVLLSFLDTSLGTRRNLLLCVDQFEEIFAFRNVAASEGDDGSIAGAATNQNPSQSGVSLARSASHRAEADQFVALLLELAQRRELPVYVVLTMRSDFLGDCDVFRGLPEAMNEARYLVPRLTRDQLRLAIEGPARLSGAALAPRLLDRMLNDVGDRADQLPVLQHALSRTWRYWRGRDPLGEGEITPGDFEAVGTLNRALSQDAEAALAEIDAAVAKRVFQCLTDTDSRKRRVRRAATVALLSAVTEASLPEITRTLQVFCAEERHFLTLSGRADDPTTRVLITHESLIRRWETVQKWVDEERDARDAFFDYAKRAHQWTLRAGGLLSGADLVLARRWRTNAKPNPSWAGRYPGATDLPTVLSYIDESRRAELFRVWSLRGAVVAVMLGLIAFTLVLRMESKDAKAQRQSANEQRRSALKAKSAAEHAFERSKDFAKLFVAYRSTNLAEAASLLREVSDTSAITSGWSEVASGIYERDITASEIPLESISFAFSPDGRLIASGAEGSPLRVGNADGSGRPLLLAGHENTIWCLAFSPDGSRIVTGSMDHTLRVWNTDGSGAPLVLRGHVGEVYSVAFSPDGRYVVSGSSDHTVRLWKADGSGGGQILWTHGDVVWSVAFSPDGQKIASGSADHTIRVGSANGTGQPIVLKGHTDRVASVAFSPDGRQIASGSADKSIRIWNVDASGSAIVLRGHQDAVWSVAFHPDGRHIASGSWDRTVRVWNVDGIGQPVVHRGPADKVTKVSFTPDGHYVAAVSLDSKLRMWNARGGWQPLVLKGHSDTVTAVSFSPDGSRIASGSKDKTVRIWPVDGSADPVVLKGHENWVWALAFAPDGRHIVSGSEDKTVRVWSTDGTEPPRVLLGHEKAVNGVAFSHDGRLVASGSDDKTVRVWNVDGNGQPVVLKGHEMQVWSVAFSPDGRHVASGSSDKSIRIWNADGQGQPLVLPGHEETVSVVSFSPDGRFIVSGSDDRTVRVWKVEEAVPVSMMEKCTKLVALGGQADEGKQDKCPKPLVLRGHDDEIWSVAFSKDGNQIVSGSKDKTVRVWNADGTGQPLVLKGHEGGVGDVSFSPDGRRIVSGSEDKTIRVWLATPDLLMRALWAARSRCLSPARREELLFESKKDAQRAFEQCTKELTTHDSDTP